jgi:hypothetical protein
VIATVYALRLLILACLIRKMEMTRDMACNTGVSRCGWEVSNIRNGISIENSDCRKGNTENNVIDRVRGRQRRAPQTARRTEKSSPLRVRRPVFHGNSQHNASAENHVLKRHIQEKQQTHLRSSFYFNLCKV